MSAGTTASVGGTGAPGADDTSSAAGNPTATAGGVAASGGVATTGGVVTTLGGTHAAGGSNSSGTSNAIGGQSLGSGGAATSVGGAFSGVGGKALVTGGAAAVTGGATSSSTGGKGDGGSGGASSWVAGAGNGSVENGGKAGAATSPGGCSTTVDCLGVCGGNAVLDCMGVCGGTAMYNCDGKSCGSDGCGGICTCSTGSVCNPATSLCECVPQCNGLTCGSDGCGGTCGACGTGEYCCAGACGLSTPASSCAAPIHFLDPTNSNITGVTSLPSDKERELYRNAVGEAWLKVSFSDTDASTMHEHRARFILEHESDDYDLEVYCGSADCGGALLGASRTLGVTAEVVEYAEGVNVNVYQSAVMWIHVVPVTVTSCTQWKLRGLIAWSSSGISGKKCPTTTN